MGDKKIYSINFGIVLLIIVAITVIIIMINSTSSNGNLTNNVENNLNSIEEVNKIENNNISKENVEQQNNIINSVDNNTTLNTNLSSEYKISSRDKYLSIGEWGIASKFENTNKYKDVGVQIYEIIKGDEAKNTLEKWSQENNTSYAVLAEGMEWKVIKYRLNLTNIQMTNYGNSQSIDMEIQGIGTSTSVKYNNKIYNITPISLTSSKYVNTNVGEGAIAVQMPIGYTDYLVVVGNGTNTRAYFKGI